MLKIIKVMAFVTTVAALSACSKNEVPKQEKSEAAMEQMSKSKDVSASASASASAVGVITAIDTKENLITINHEAISAIHWPAMTMAFKVADPGLLNDLNVGQQIKFDLKSENGNFIVTTIKTVQKTS